MKIISNEFRNISKIETRRKVTFSQFISTKPNGLRRKVLVIARYVNDVLDFEEIYLTNKKNCVGVSVVMSDDGDYCVMDVAVAPNKWKN